MRSSKEFPFNTLVLPEGEVSMWQASNPGFHRTSDYGITVSNVALYLYSPFWLWFARWKRYPLKSITGVTFQDSRWIPKLVIKLGGSTVVFRTPFDSHKGEMDIDRKNLSQTVEKIERFRNAPNYAIKGTSA